MTKKVEYVGFYDSPMKTFSVALSSGEVVLENLPSIEAAKAYATLLNEGLMYQDDDMTWHFFFDYEDSADFLEEQAGLNTSNATSNSMSKPPQEVA